MSAAPEDPAVAVIEQILDAASCPQDSLSAEDGKAVAERALWICACVTTDDAPKWLICDTPAGAFTWRRVPMRTEPLDLVVARFTAGGHAAPAEVLRWLQGHASDPWGGGGGGIEDAGVLDSLRRRINGE